MNRVDVGAEGLEPPLWSGALAAFALKVLDFIGRDNWDLSVLLCGDETIKALNGRYRGRNEATDVLSFELGAETAAGDGDLRYLPGDIVISLETLRENARCFETSEDEELRRLLINGINHLDGMDHNSNDKDEPMLKLQENLLEQFKGERVLPFEETRGGGER
ncbi:MAG: rRNA maturation RNase YbeY [Treponema sp.]|jgi:probable rRNA maturation factor|nr:rRNA maturation RNase YbeY [Treponema sp.]